MNKDIFLIYPHQLFEDITNLIDKKVILIEEPLFFTQYKFHIQKLVMHRASMKFYENYLKSNKVEVEYYENQEYISKYFKENVFYYDVADDWLEKKIESFFLNITVLESPNFYNFKYDNNFLHFYYIEHRKKLQLFVDENNKPFGGKWSFDSENRKKLPKNEILPCVKTYENKYLKEAKEYCKKFNTVGSVENFYFPITFDDARKNLDYFLSDKFSKFGDYQDAIIEKESFAYHSNLSSSLNIGLLNPRYIIEKVSEYPDVPFNAKEGFVRQIIGWREFMLKVYKDNHVGLRTTNYFKFNNRLNEKILNGETGLKPFDDAIKKLHKTSYNHHIERLMVIGNLFLLLEIHPDDVYEFFMSYYIDAYDWVMVGNVYGMSGFSDGGTITTKPYISSSNYIIKMSSDYKKNEYWCELWDGLYWRFMKKYSSMFKNNPRMKMQISLMDNMDSAKMDNHLTNADICMSIIFNKNP